MIIVKVKWPDSSCPTRNRNRIRFEIESENEFEKSPQIKLIVSKFSEFHLTVFSSTLLSRAREDLSLLFFSKFEKKNESENSNWFFFFVYFDLLFYS